MQSHIDGVPPLYEFINTIFVKTVVQTQNLVSLQKNNLFLGNNYTNLL